MTRTEVIEQLLDTTAQCRHTETEVVDLENMRRGHEFTLKDQEARLLDSGPITGKNAEARAAQLFSLTGPERVLIMDMENRIALRKAELSGYRLLHRSLLAIAVLLAGSSDTEASSS